MQTKKYISLVLMLTLFLSTTGIPVAMHLCKSMNEVSFKSCSMCSSHDNDNTLKIKRESCCGSKILASPGANLYLMTKQIDQEILRISDVITLQNDSDYAASTENLLQLRNVTGSPPTEENTPLFITNLSLLI